MNYKDIMLSDHALTQMKARGLDAEEVWQTYKHPTDYQKGKEDTFHFKKVFDQGFTVTLIGVQTKRNNWLIVSAWREPPLPGTADAKRRKQWKIFNKAKFWGQLWIQIKQQLGIS